MTEFNQAKFENKAKKLVVKYLNYLNYKVNEKEVFIVWFSKIGKNAKAMLGSDQDYRYFEVTYFGEEGNYVVDVYDVAAKGEFNEENMAMKMSDNQHLYSEISKDGSTSHVQIGVDKVTASVETRCPICQEHLDILGITDAFDLQIKEGILILMDTLFHNDMRYPKEVFKIKYCPSCGRKL